MHHYRQIVRKLRTISNCFFLFLGTTIVVSYDKCKGNGATDNQRPFNAHLHAYVVYKKIYGMQAAVVLNLMHKGKDLLAFMK